ncbi:ly-6/neurotoxin-like protein 1 [Budorcas taxicolor]|uniref:ly-6/neurotoxin-like protein 1 n=1 Tax=Budorcas taxicolor TaxID=37181 RepID=UPI002283D66C|nr:ly-6/neurotoxin-like protein 1 [Budorcas taxicolor]
MKMEMEKVDRMEDIWEGKSTAVAPLPTLFLVALVGRLVAQALDCHVCAYSGENCFKPMCCLAVVTYGTTTQTYYTPVRMKVSKPCVPSCFETIYNGCSKLIRTTSCCQHNLCNGSGLLAPWPLALVLILLVTLGSLL